MVLIFIIVVICIFGYLHLQSSANSMHRNQYPVWNNESISISGHHNNDEFKKFLDKNNGKIVYLATSLDMSITGVESFEEENLSYIGVWEGFSNGPDYKNPTYAGIDRFVEDSSLSLPLDGSSNMKVNFLRFNLLHNRPLPITQGGTGIHIFPINSYFKVQILGRSGPSTIYELTEVQQNINLSIQ